MDDNLRNALLLSAALSFVTALFTWACNQMLLTFFERVKHGDISEEDDSQEGMQANGEVALSRYDQNRSEEVVNRNGSAKVEVAEECFA